MIRRSRATLSSLLGLALAAVFLGGCGAASATPAATPPGPGLSPRTTLPAGSPSASVPASGSAAPSGSASDGSPSASASDPLNLPHIDAALEANLPSKIGGVDLFKFSLTLQAYIASTPGAGEDALYLPWLVKFSKTPADVNIAIATDLTDQENFIAHAIEVPGAAAAALSSGFDDAATKAGWPVKSHTNWGSTGKTVLEIIDPAAQAAGGLYDAFVYAKDDVLYTVITDDQDLLIEALIKMP
jgi:hypothetical protein